MSPLASMSLDLDNLWAYKMTHGEEDWTPNDTYLDVLVPMVLEFLDSRRLEITFFVVGQDAALEVNEKSLRTISDAGHEIGNHSYNHEPWLHRYGVEELDRELAMAEAAIEDVTGQRTVGFRGPGYSLSEDVLRTLVARGYRYDCSTLPTMIGPLARWYYFKSAKLTAAQREERSTLFGGFREGLRPMQPYTWQVGPDRLLEIPVTTTPFVRVPVHLSYVLYIAGVSPGLARQYFRSSVRLWRKMGVEPSVLLHPLDFLGADDVDQLGFFPGMKLSGVSKRAIVAACIDELRDQFEIVSMVRHADAIMSRGTRLKSVPAAEATPVLERAK